jgi:hypothetical protein
MSASNFIFNDLFSTPAYAISLSSSNQPPAYSTLIPMSLLGKQYNCAIPDSHNTHSSMDIISSPDASLSLGSALNILKSIPTPQKCIFYNRGGWWTYQFCFNNHFSQIHVPSETELLDLQGMTPEDRRKKKEEHNVLVGKFSALHTSKQVGPSKTEIVKVKVGFIGITMRILLHI